VRVRSWGHNFGLDFDLDDKISVLVSVVSSRVRSRCREFDLGFGGLVQFNITARAGFKCVEALGQDHYYRPIRFPFVNKVGVIRNLPSVL